MTLIYKKRKFIPPVWSLYSDLTLIANRDEIKLISSDGKEYSISKFLFTAKSDLFKRVLQSPRSKYLNNQIWFGSTLTRISWKLCYIIWKVIHLTRYPKTDDSLAVRYELPGTFKLCEHVYLNKMKSELDVDTSHLAVKFGTYILIRKYQKFLSDKSWVACVLFWSISIIFQTREAFWS